MSDALLIKIGNEETFLVETEYNISYISVVLTTEDGLKRHQWRYRYFDHQNVLRCVWYGYQERPSRRHKFLTQKFWSHTDRRHNTLDKPLMVESVERYAKQGFIETVGVVTE